MHRDLYGEKVFPLQVVINLNNPGVDHTGGEFLLVEQRPRAQSRGTATLIPQGNGLVFTTHDRPVRSARGWSASAVTVCPRYAAGSGTRWAWCSTTPPDPLGPTSAFTSNAERAAALPAWPHTYNHHRTHTAIGGHPPITRVNNPAGTYS